MASKGCSSLSENVPQANMLHIITKRSEQEIENEKLKATIQELRSELALYKLTKNHQEKQKLQPKQPESGFFSGLFSSNKSSSKDAVDLKKSVINSRKEISRLVNEINRLQQEIKSREEVILEQIRFTNQITQELNDNTVNINKKFNFGVVLYARTRENAGPSENLLDKEGKPLAVQIVAKYQANLLAEAQIDTKEVQRRLEETLTRKEQTISNLMDSLKTSKEENCKQNAEFRKKIEIETQKLHFCAAESADKDIKLKNLKERLFNNQHILEIERKSIQEQNWRVSKLEKENHVKNDEIRQLKKQVDEQEDTIKNQRARLEAIETRHKIAQEKTMASYECLQEEHKLLENKAKALEQDFDAQTKTLQNANRSLDYTRQRLDVEIKSRLEVQSKLRSEQDSSAAKVKDLQRVLKNNMTEVLQQVLLNLRSTEEKLNTESKTREKQRTELESEKQINDKLKQEELHLAEQLKLKTEEQKALKFKYEAQLEKLNETSNKLHKAQLSLEEEKRSRKVAEEKLNFSEDIFRSMKELCVKEMREMRDFVNQAARVGSQKTENVSCKDSKIYVRENMALEKQLENQTKEIALLKLELKEREAEIQRLASSERSESKREEMTALHDEFINALKKFDGQ